MIDFAGQQAEFIEKIIEWIQQKLPASEAKQIANFASQYYSRVAEEDLAERQISDLSAALVSQWQFMRDRAPNETKIRVFNPSPEQNGWQSTHTIVEVNCNDMPFLVDSLRMEINHEGLNIHLMIHMGGLRTVRDEHNRISKVLEYGSNETYTHQEAVIRIEIDRQNDAGVLTHLQGELTRVLNDVSTTVVDWKPMRERVLLAIEELTQTKAPLDPNEIAESRDFLHWLVNDHFTLLGCREYELTKDQDSYVLCPLPETGLGILHAANKSTQRFLTAMTKEAQELLLSPQILIISKTNTRSTVHRPAYTDYIGVKRFSSDGKVIGELRIVGLYTSTAYNSNPKHIPFLRRKVATIMQMAQFSSNGHAGKALLNILETLPRDDLFQASVEELFNLSMGILHLQERQRIRLFSRRDIYGRFISCLVFVPKERFNTELCDAIGKVLMKAFSGLEIDVSTLFSESILARIHYLIRIDSTKTLQYDLKKIESDVFLATRSWHDELVEVLKNALPEERANKLLHAYHKAFPSSYREEYSPAVAMYDIEHIEKVLQTKTIEMSFFRRLDTTENESLHFKLFNDAVTVPLSDVVPILECLGLRVIEESPYQIVTAKERTVWINDFILQPIISHPIDVDAMKIKFTEAFRRIWYGQMESDHFNALILAADMDWQEVSILRAYTKYLWQIGFTFSQHYIAETVVRNAIIAKLIVQVFYLRFSPEHADDSGTVEKVIAQIFLELNKVTSLDEDRILRRILDVILATVRTNFFQTKNQKSKSYFSFKVNSAKIPEMPLPVPLFEIFVYSPRFEGIHLRGAKVARGGLRWSDRREDFRTEVLGLMKAQKVKNAVIVPSGAKGGFILKLLPTDGNRESLMAEVIACYQDFIRGLLDLTDNWQNGVIVPPADTRRYDEDDYYLVVAADKGTATFSDYANEISAEYQFWLGDAFASGGSAGYDHKKMGITARGAWISVQRHFREMGINIQKTDFTVVGIGDMAGDVFGNGMLLSPHIQLVAAFNHMHIFLDPYPDAQKSFAERERLFNTPRTSWQDYDTNLISSGGGIFNRSVKSIALSLEVKKVLGIAPDIETMMPNELIQAMLCAPVDLLWNGGIGTYVKATGESNLEVGDRTNDVLRICGKNLRARVVGEGGNLGFTQLGRIEYALNGGRINTDFIDNSGGVDCSDHEVNLKILLNNQVVNGDMTLKQRNELLVQMTDDVADLVLQNNTKQSLALSLAEVRAVAYHDLYMRYIQDIERAGKLDRALEFLPTNEGMIERKAKGKALTRPELAILLAYSKSIVKESLLQSSAPEDPYLAKIIAKEFPAIISEKYPEAMVQHSLRREIIVTFLSNILINEMGITFDFRLQHESGSNSADIVRGYAIVRQLLEISDIWDELEGLKDQIPSAIIYDLLIQLNRLARRSTRWFLRNANLVANISETISEFKDSYDSLNQALPHLLLDEELNYRQQLLDKYLTQKVPEGLAFNIANMPAMFSALDIIQAAREHQYDVIEVASIYFTLGAKLDLGWVREQLSEHQVENSWDALMREALRDDLDRQQRTLSVAVLQHPHNNQTSEQRVIAWMKANQSLCSRWQRMLEELRARHVVDFTLYTVAVRELMDFIQTNKGT